jgi:quercetin dioxygenase-like cupin family protein
MAAVFFPDLKSEVQVPADGILSRVLHQDQQLRVVAFAFDAGQQLTDHTASRPAVVEVIEGRFELTLGDETVAAGPRSWALLTAGLPHSLTALEPSILLLTLLGGPPTVGSGDDG